ncbi:MAG TPA: hypothetical protein VGN72_08830 [Tepidisphaeraceae bacterium]|nr:hypothetical protein [Tepidisphaeraceae bacterium]
MNRIALALAVSLAVPMFTFAQQEQPAPAATNNAADDGVADTGFALTIYSSADPATFDPQELARQQVQNPYGNFPNQLPGYGVVREVRKVNIDKDGTIRFSDVASGIDPTTVTFESLTDPNGTSVLEQNYEYDVVSGNKLMEKYLGKEVTIVKRASGNEGVTTVTGRLLSSDGATVVLQSAEGVQVISRSDITTVTLADAANLITKPTLVWKLDADKGGEHLAKVTYQTDGITWRADYSIIMNANDTAADVGAWVTILNQSGANYPDAKLKLVAGDVQRVQPQQELYGGMPRAMAMADAKRADMGFQEKSFFEYHLYTLGRPTSLGNNSTKQIELFPSKKNVPVNKTFVYYGLPEQMRYWISPEPNRDRNLGTQTNKKVDVYLQTTNSEQNGMGIPLPAGRIRVYKADDADGSMEFVGEDVIQHTPKDEKVLVKLGSAFDIVGERKQTDFQVDRNDHWIEEEFEITLRNHKKEPVDVIVKENLFRWATWEIIKNSDDFEKQDSRTVHFPVRVEPDGEKKVTYRVRYTW